MIEGVDYSHARPSRAQLDAAKAKFCVRYLIDSARDRGKGLTRTEALTLNSWGRFVVSNFEYEVGGPKRGFNQGVADARTALAEIQEMGIPRRVVYFSIDWDMTDAEWPAVRAYLDGCASIVGKANVGVYGGLRAVSRAYSAGYRWLWQTYAWSGGIWHFSSTIQQYRNDAFPDWSGDKCRAMVADYGQWSLTGMENDMKLDPITLDPDITRLTDNYPKPSGDVEYDRYIQYVYMRAHNAEKAAELCLEKVLELLERPTGTMPTASEIAAEIIRQLQA